MTLDHKNIRKDMKKCRRQLNKYQQKKSAQRILNQLRKNHVFKHAKNIGLYISAFGEIETKLLIEYCFSKQKKVYLPVISNMNQKLIWVSIHKYQFRSQRFTNHNLGMQQPFASRGQHVSKLDLLLMPLLACDKTGSRIGMGGGYYDRTLADAPRKPFRLGVAHHFQLIDSHLKREPWDQPLDALVTPEIFLRFKR